MEEEELTVFGRDPKDPTGGGIVGGPGGVRSPWSRDPEGEVESAIELEQGAPLFKVDPLRRLLAAEGTSSSSRA